MSLASTKRTISRRPALTADPLDPGALPRRGPGWRATAAATILYALGLAAATFPYVGKMATDLPTVGDPPQHVWIMRWYRLCLLEGRSPLICPELQFPTGAPLSGFSPLQFQAALFVPLSLVIHNDIVCYNLLWAAGMITTGLGILALAWYVVRNRPAAIIGGLLGMLSGPMMLHAHGHLELIYLGSFPIFLLAWLRFLERPGWRRLVAAAGLYILMSTCAAYYMVMGIVLAQPGGEQRCRCGTGQAAFGPGCGRARSGLAGSSRVFFLA